MGAVVAVAAGVSVGAGVAVWANAAGVKPTSVKVSSALRSNGRRASLAFGMGISQLHASGAIQATRPQGSCHTVPPSVTLRRDCVAVVSLRP